MDARFGYIPDSLEKVFDSVGEPFGSTDLDLGGLDEIGKLKAVKPISEINSEDIKRLIDGARKAGNHDACSVEPIDLRPKFVVVEKENLEEFVKAVNEKLNEGYRLHGGMNAVQRGDSIVYIQALFL